MEFLKSELGDDNRDVFAYLLGQAFVFVGASPKVTHPLPSNSPASSCLLLMERILFGKLAQRALVLGRFLRCCPAESSHCAGAWADAAQRDKSPTQAASSHSLPSRESRARTVRRRGESAGSYCLPLLQS